MAQRTSEEILAQREAWMARKAARESGQDVPLQPPLKPGETAPEPAVVEAAPPAEPTPVAPTPEPEPEPVVAATAPEPAAQPAAAAPAVATVGPQRPAQKRTPEEILAQREAWMARKAAREAGLAAPAPAPEPKPAAVATAQPIAPKPAAATAKPAAATAKAAAKKKPAAKKPKPAPPPADPNVTRREFLNYAWLASIALFSVETVGFSLWFAFPNFKAGEFGGAFEIGDAAGVLPEVNAGPIPYTDGKFWLVNLDTEFDGEPRKGVMAIYKVCTHLGCLYEWIPMTGRFECPCHGSKFALNGDYVGGPARRSLDYFVVQAVSPDGSIKETDPETGGPLEINGDEILTIDTGRRILGSSDIIPA